MPGPSSGHSRRVAGRVNPSCFALLPMGLARPLCYHSAGALLPRHFTFAREREKGKGKREKNTAPICGKFAQAFNEEGTVLFPFSFSLFPEFRLCIFCCAFRQVTLPGRYPASRPVKPGLSSPAANRRSDHPTCSTVIVHWKAPIRQMKRPICAKTVVSAPEKQERQAEQAGHRRRLRPFHFPVLRHTSGKVAGNAGVHVNGVLAVIGLNHASILVALPKLPDMANSCATFDHASVLVTLRYQIAIRALC